MMMMCVLVVRDGDVYAALRDCYTALHLDVCFGCQGRRCVRSTARLLHCIAS